MTDQTNDQIEQARKSERQAAIDAGQYRDYTIKTARRLDEDGEPSTRWEILTEQSIGFVRDFGSVEPQPGDPVRLYGRGSLIQGLDLQGVPVDFTTEGELAAEGARMALERETKMLNEYLEHRDEWDQQFSELPPTMQTRIRIFRDHCKSFRWEYEPYELFISTEAANLFDFARQVEFNGENSVELDGAQVPLVRITESSSAEQVDALLTWFRNDDEAQKTVFTTSEHSGNTFGASVRLAQMALLDFIDYRPNGLDDDPEIAGFPLVVLMHASISPLTGCDPVGCVHPRPKEYLTA